MVVRDSQIREIKVQFNKYRWKKFPKEIDFYLYINNKKKIFLKNVLKIYFQNIKKKRNTVQFSTFNIGIFFNIKDNKTYLIKLYPYRKKLLILFHIIFIDVEFSIIKNKSKTKIKDNNKELSNFFLKLNHEIRTPCIAITNILNELLKEIRIRNDIYIMNENLNQILSLSENMISSINIICDYLNGLELIKFNEEIITLKEISEWALNILKCKVKSSMKSSLIEINLELNENLKKLKLRTDIGKLKSIIIELIKNSVLYTSSGFITIKIDYEKSYNFGSSHDIQKNNNENSDKDISFMIIDSGIGFSKSKIISLEDKMNNSENKIKDINDFSRYGSLNLGLFVINKYSEKLKLRLKINSKERQGSIFSVCLKSIIQQPSILRSNREIFSLGSKIIRHQNIIFQNKPFLSQLINEKNKLISNSTNFQSVFTVEEENEYENIFENTRKNSKFSSIKSQKRLSYDYDSDNSLSMKLDELNKKDLEYLRENLSNIKKINTLTNISLLNNLDFLDIKKIDNNKEKVTVKSKYKSESNFTSINYDYENNKKMIIICDDDFYCLDSIKKLIERILDNHNCNEKYKIITLKDGIDLINFCINAYENKIEIKLIFSDENMTYLNGSSTLKILNEINSKLNYFNDSFYILTALNNKDIINQIKKNCKDVLNKPINLSKLELIFKKNKIIN